tara:strand:+ start:34743 stop:35552 length:810 start_codon:yes stop_codon:yes gene_type:complete
MKIQDIITESQWGQRLVPVSAYFKYHDQFTPAREAFDQGRRIYRGIYVYDTDFFYQPRMQPGTRKSANIANWYTLIMDNVPEWSKFPKRSASVICTTDPAATNDYGVTFNVLPFGDPIIGICPQEDIWFSFPLLKKVGMEALDELMEAMGILAQMYLDKKLSQDTWSDFTQGLQLLTQQILQDYKSSEWDFVNKLQERVTLKQDMLMVLRKILDPQAAGFKTARLSKWQPEPQKEIWFSAEAFFLQSGWVGQRIGLDARMKQLIDTESS